MVHRQLIKEQIIVLHHYSPVNHYVFLHGQLYFALIFIHTINQVGSQDALYRKMHIID